MTEVETRQRLNRRRAMLLAAGSAGAAAIGLIGTRSDAAAVAASEAGIEPAVWGQGSNGIVVSGSGRATGDVTGGILQLLIRYSPSAPQLSQSSAGGESYYSASVAAPDEDALTAVVNALIDGGIDREQIITHIGSSAMYGLFGSGVSVVGALLDETTVAALGEIVPNVIDAAESTNLQFDQIGAAYFAADCAAVSDAALEAAITDARAQAQALAAALGVELGELTGASANPPYSPYGGYEGGSGCAAVFELEDAIRNYFPPYIAGVEPEFSMSASVTLTFDISGD